MSILPIIIAPDKRLKTKAAPVSVVNESIRALMDDMLETMYEAPGIGLAAPQVGVMARIIVLDIAEDDEPKQPLRIINPEITWRSEEVEIFNEGCLSLPDIYADIERPTAIKMRYLDETGAPRELSAEGLLATCLQHEIDHLNGILFIDYLSLVKRNMIVRKLQKLKKLDE